MFPLALLAAAISAISSSIAAILQKVAAVREAEARSLDFGLYLKLLRDMPYVIGVILDLLAGACVLFSVRVLPLFLAQSIFAASVVVTPLIDRFALKHHLRRRTAVAVVLVIVGLVLLGTAAVPAPVPSLPRIAWWMIVFGPPIVAVLALPLLRLKHKAGGVGIALLAGLTFGGASVGARVIYVPSPLWHLVYSPMALALVGYAVLGTLLFTISLQRGSVTAMNASLVASETLAPATLGFTLLGDTVRSGFLPVLLAGCVLTIGGIFSVLFTHKSAI